MTENDLELDEALDLIDRNLETMTEDVLVGLVENIVSELGHRSKRVQIKIVYKTVDGKVVE